MAAISTSLRTAPNHNFGLYSKGQTNLVERNHYSGPSGGYHHYEHHPQKKHKRSIAFSALTLLAFLFFLNILQNCIQDHMNQMTTTPSIIVVTTAAPPTAGAYISRYREAEENEFSNISRSDKNIDNIFHQREKISNAHRKT